MLHVGEYCSCKSVEFSHAPDPDNHRYGYFGHDFCINIIKLRRSTPIWSKKILY